MQRQNRIAAGTRAVATSNIIVFPVQGAVVEVPIEARDFMTDAKAGDTL